MTQTMASSSSSSRPMGIYERQQKKSKRVVFSPHLSQPAGFMANRKWGNRPFWEPLVCWPNCSARDLRRVQLCYTSSRGHRQRKTPKLDFNRCSCATTAPLSHGPSPAPSHRLPYSVLEQPCARSDSRNFIRSCIKLPNPKSGEYKLNYICNKCPLT